MHYVEGMCSKQAQSKVHPKLWCLGGQADRIAMLVGCLSPRKLAQHFCLIGLFSKQFVYISVTFLRFFPQLNFVLEWIGLQLITIDDGKVL